MKDRKGNGRGVLRLYSLDVDILSVLRAPAPRENPKV